MHKPASWRVLGVYAGRISNPTFFYNAAVNLVQVEREQGDTARRYRELVRAGLDSRLLDLDLRGFAGFVVRHRVGAGDPPALSAS